MSLCDLDLMFLRSSPWARIVESLQQAFTWLCPANKQSPALPRPTVVMLRLVDENSIPDEDHCEV